MYLWVRRNFDDAAAAATVAATENILIHILFMVCRMRTKVHCLKKSNLYERRIKAKGSMSFMVSYSIHICELTLYMMMTELYIYICL